MTEDTEAAAVSTQLAAAQAQLQRLRRQRRQERLEAGLPIRTDAHGRLQNIPYPTRKSVTQATLATHLGWESEGLRRAQHVSASRRAARERRQEALTLSWLPSLAAPRSATPTNSHPSPVSPPSLTIRLFPDLALAMLRQDAAAAGRLWLLLRHLDQAGSGWLSEAEVRAQLASPGAPLRLCGWRQLRNLLAQGEGVFWQRGESGGERRIWLAGTARVALSLGVSVFRLAPVALPVTTLLQGIGAVRAHFYASYHSGQERPIARATLEAVSAVSRRSQRAYERQAGIRCQENWAIGPRCTTSSRQEMTWQRGQAVFTFTDYRGTYGPAGEQHLAWQLPNNYKGPHRTQGQRPPKALNQRLVDLYSKGTTGNGRKQVEKPAQEKTRPASRFYDTGLVAVRAFHRAPHEDVYWRTTRHEKQYHIWHLLPASRERR